MIVPTTKMNAFFQPTCATSNWHKERSHNEGWISNRYQKGNEEDFDFVREFEDSFKGVWNFVFQIFFTMLQYLCLTVRNAAAALNKFRKNEMVSENSQFIKNLETVQ